MMIAVTCCKCGEELEYPQQLQNQIEPCPSCGNHNRLGLGVAQRSRRRTMIFMTAVLLGVATGLVGGYAWGRGCGFKKGYDKGNLNAMVSPDAITASIASSQALDTDHLVGMVMMTFPAPPTPAVRSFVGGINFIGDDGQSISRLPLEYHDIDQRAALLTFNWTVPQAAQLTAHMLNGKMPGVVPEVEIYAVTDARGMTRYFFPGQADIASMDTSPVQQATQPQLSDSYPECPIEAALLTSDVEAGMLITYVCFGIQPELMARGIKAIIGGVIMYDSKGNKAAVLPFTVTAFGPFPARCPCPNIYASAVEHPGCAENVVQIFNDTTGKYTSAVMITAIQDSQGVIHYFSPDK